MPNEVRLWRVGADDDLSEVSRARLDLEARLQSWLARDISTLDPRLLVIGREVETDFGGFIDLLCLDAAGDLVVVELKRDKTPREITAQALDYGSWVVGLSNERVMSIAESYLGEGGLEKEFQLRFGTELPETLNGEHSMLIVGSNIDASSERIIKYLSDTHGVNINAVTFQYFREPDGSELVSRVFLIEPAQVELSSRTRGSSKRRPNLTFEELLALAESNGVLQLYQHGVNELEGLLVSGRTLSSIVFSGSIDGSRKVVFSLIPAESSAEEGLRYHLYRHRFAKLAGLTLEALLDIVPAHHDYWIYTRNGGPDEEGFQGFIKSPEELNHLAAALSHS